MVRLGETRYFARNPRRRNSRLPRGCPLANIVDASCRSSIRVVIRITLPLKEFLGRKCRGNSGDYCTVPLTSLADDAATERRVTALESFATRLDRDGYCWRAGKVSMTKMQINRSFAVGAVAFGAVGFGCYSNRCACNWRYGNRCACYWCAQHTETSPDGRTA